MSKRTTDGTCLEALARSAASVCKEAERRTPRTGPGRKPEIPDWLMATLIMIAILKRRKSKSAQYRFLSAHRQQLADWLGSDRFPARSTYFDRYRRAHPLFRTAIALQGQQAVKQRLADASTVAVDKSLLAARGPRWNKSDRRRGVVPRGLRGVDRDSEWTYTKSRGWVQGYSYEVVVSAGKSGVVFPLQASADTAKASEPETALAKLAQLPAETENALADSAYDSVKVQQEVEGTPEQPTGRTFYCPVVARGRPPRGARRSHVANPERIRRQQRMGTRTAKRIFARRSATVEPFNEWFKAAFELERTVWHRGLQNNQTQLLAGLSAYQLLVLHLNRKRHKKNHNGQIQKLLDAL
jgi:hypothetical protein